MDENSLEEGPMMNFERSTLELARERENPEQNQSLPSTETATRDSGASSNIPIETGRLYRDLPTVTCKHMKQIFFSDRTAAMEDAIKDCHEVISKKTKNVEFIGSWLLTQITLWDTEKERLVLLSKDTLYSVKYDFISLKVLDYSIIPYLELDTVMAGDLVYPSTSLIPRLNGLAEGVSSIIYSAVHQQWPYLTAPSSLARLEPRNRRKNGLRLMWNKGQPLSFDAKWNPFSKNVPWFTYTDHPLLWFKGTEAERAKFNVRTLYSTLVTVLPTQCRIMNNPIVLNNYVGLGALVHNRNSLGFFKYRGKFSF